MKSRCREVGTGHDHHSGGAGFRRLWGFGLGVVAVLALATAFAQAPYFIQADTVRGAVGAQGAVCVINSVFLNGEEVVFRAYVYDAATGQPLTQDKIDASGITVSGMIDGQQVAGLNFTPHPPEAADTELYWAGAWAIPADYPAGNYSWSVRVQDAAGNVVDYLPMGHTIGLGTLTIAAPAAAAAPATQGAG